MADIFKKPTLPSELSILNTKSENSFEKEDVLRDSEPEAQSHNTTELKIQSENISISSKTLKLNLPTQPLPYAEPSWGGHPDVFYSLEELKSGVSLRTIPLDNKSFFSFGRLENCNIVMAHPTVSRYHAILQFRSTFSETDEKRGFYLYDLSSTHGTFLNKEKIPPKTYIKVQVGHMIKFGSSTRVFLLQGPDDDQDAESQYSYTQLKELRKQQLEQREKDYLNERAKLLAEKEAEEAKGIDWGMGEDADEETDLTENPYAETSNEDMYKDDPKKVLKLWFERQGEELHYKIEEKGLGQFRCAIELPLENAGGGYVIAEAVVSGRKKEASFQCALEACRLLDKANLLKQPTLESRKRKLKNWEEDDYYDSDEDNYFDRTGELEAKRKQRMKQVKKTQSTADTYETLIEKHKNLLKEIGDIERKLNTMLVEGNYTRDNDDNWESFTSQKQSGQVIDKLEQKKMKNTLTVLKTDEEKLRKLINFLKPFELPEITFLSGVSIKKESEDTIYPYVKTELVVSKSNISGTEEPNVTAKTEVVEEKITTSSPTKVTKCDEVATKPTKFLSSEFKKPPSKPVNSAERAKKIAQSFSNQYEEDFNNIVWTPPANQSGDGRTSLNDKLGY